MKKLISIIFAGVLVSFSVTTIAYNEGSMPSPDNTPFKHINRIVAVVNKEIITRTELDLAINSAKQQFKQHGVKVPSEQALREKILQGLIYQKLQLQLAEQNKITVDESDIDGAIANIAQQNKISLEQLKQKLSQQNISYKAFRLQIRDQMIVSKLQQQAIASNIHITPDQIALFKQKLAKQNAVTDYHVIDYLIPVAANATDSQKQAALATAKKVLAQLKQNKKVSNHVVTTSDMGWNSATDLPDIFSRHLIKMRKGQVTGPILTGNGYHVIKLVGTKMKNSTITDQQAQQLLFQQKFRKALQKWLDGIKKQAYIKVYTRHK